MKKNIIPLLIILITATGCEGALYKFIYNSMDSIIYRMVADYTDPKPEQELLLRQKIDAFMKWHRGRELPRYAATLRDLRSRMAAGLREADLDWMRQRFERHGADIFNATSGDVVEYLLSLDQGQVDRMKRRFDESIVKMEKESAVSDEKRFREMERTAARMMEFLYGTLTEKQKDEIARGVRQVDNLDRDRIRMYRERQAEFIALLRGRPGRETLRDYIRRMTIDSERSYPDYYRERSERRDRAIAGAFLRFDRDLVTPVQRANAVKKIDMLIQVLNELNKG
ncbi:MAG TPA: DUF6279 family lipoprotein [Spirochaetota bacterium]|nr:DUF6279 family lipoprotein [Spirochaetota bacterium]